MNSIFKTDSLQALQYTIKTIPVLTNEEESSLLLDYYNNKSKVVAEKIICNNIKLVYNLVVNKYSKYKSIAMDLIQEGVIGLIIALDKFDPKKNVKFSTYAFWWVRAQINNYLCDNTSVVKRFYGGGNKEKIIDGKRTYVGTATGYNVYKAVNDGLTREEIANSINVTEENLDKYLLRIYQQEIPIDAYGNSFDEKDAPDKNLILADYNTPEDIVETKLDALNRSIILNKIKEKFNERELFIIQHRLIEEDMTGQEVGDIYKISRERVRQIENNVRSRLKTLLNKKNCGGLYV